MPRIGTQCFGEGGLLQSPVVWSKIPELDLKCPSAILNCTLGGGQRGCENVTAEKESVKYEAKEEI